MAADEAVKKTRVIVACKLNGGMRRAGLFVPDTQTEFTVTDAQLAELKGEGDIVVLEGETADKTEIRLSEQVLKLKARILELDAVIEKQKKAIADLTAPKPAQ